MKRIVWLLILAGFGISGAASAACLQLTPAQIAEVQSHGYLGYQNLQLNVVFPEGSVSIDPDLTVGSLIATGYTVPVSIQSAIVACTNTGSMNADYYTPPQQSPLPNYYKTNVEGIGFRLSYVRADGNESQFPFVINVPLAAPPDPPDGVVYGYLGAGARFKIELVKTGDIANSNSSVAFTGPVGTGRANGDGKTVTTVTSGGIVVKIQPSCRVDSSEQNIDFGTFGPADVSATSGPTRPVNFTVRCSGPTPPASITAMLKGTPDSDDHSMLKNTGAANLAIRLKEISTNIVLRPNDSASTITHAPIIGMQSPFALEATVLRVGNVPPTAGKIQATATILMTLL
ncbi:fimbrial protein [Burkholderia cepacia]|uniref:fimbrial protein n=1 Tax=Burkholderia cepacia TaxID=292 RepID=UPI0035291F6A